MIENIARYHTQIAIASLVVYELMRGVHLLPDSKKRLKTFDYIETVLLKFPILAYGETAAKWHGQQAALLQQLGKTPAFVDAQIAAIAKANNLILITRNVDDFQNFTDLAVENWFC